MNQSEALDLPAQKKVLRGRMKAARAVLSAAQRVADEASIAARLLPILQPFLCRKSIIAVYLSTAEELSLDRLIRALLHLQARVAAPCGTAPGDFPFARLHDLRAVSLNAFGVREPQHEPPELARAADVHVALVPGLAFDGQGGRLGYGGGWYDRVLPAVPLAIGVCFDCQLLEEVPREKHDSGVDALVTPARTIDVNGRLGLMFR